MDRSRSDEMLDIALEQTFPASDAPCFMAAAAVVGSPRKQKDRRRRDPLD
jgi:hypothetical protein